MGRRKPGKQRRPGKDRREYTLRELEPPGSAYEDWFIPAQDTGPLPEGIDEEAADFLDRVQRLGPIYGNEVPEAAVHLDMCLDSGKVAVLEGGAPRLVDFQGLLDRAPGQDLESVRASTHRLHALGALLVEVEEEYGVPYVRFVLKRPEKPGEPWAFMGDKGAVAATTCLPDKMWHDLPPDVAASTAYLRSCRGQLQKPTFEDFVEHHQGTDIDNARRLWDAAWASGFVDYKGCEACPAGHLCTRSDRQDE
ncbi:hypothetical protein [Streptomyces sp. NBC_01353]|uniref:hypothetical protein n=1 Tax=Streptomyces sp. NBC_01353 TaxID=2903835 RepID=UPI002E33ACCA|nr:hypothetical protein [Streptomyces sp. NBC_01353]